MKNRKIRRRRIRGEGGKRRTMAGRSTKGEVRKE